MAPVGVTAVHEEIACLGLVSGRVVLIRILYSSERRALILLFNNKRYVDFTG
jgi:hypothetical protein